MKLTGGVLLALLAVLLYFIIKKETGTQASQLPSGIPVASANMLALIGTGTITATVGQPGTPCGAGSSLYSVDPAGANYWCVSQADIQQALNLGFLP
jgi:hypothetical protein